MSSIECSKSYTLLMSRFLSGQLTGAQFEERYLEMFKNESRPMPENVYQVLNSLFYCVDAYCSDPDLRDDDDLDDSLLLARTQDAYDLLTQHDK
ncbi:MULTISPECIES: colicin immunity domain-containing protein [Vibrio]|uniref:colicin immunity domain-containing protein n=1 Tax=Vibrio TaxID=662 RepID=UPI0005FA1AD7|nr:MULTISPECIES: colicin immunity domain-containing protein [Vibrio]KJY88083.1 hypothetical protein TW84_15375 [Vibrio neptunius]MBN3573794.1 hypothetical protein [Vibrio neptunius]MDA0119044.1 colicin immunity domain-containing protein [Vibrio sp. T11.5]NRB66320.1 hypothetical protein [Vibrio sp.]QXX06355.1 hypothetical protein KW548_14935 [Vibrio neptunius]